VRLPEATQAALLSLRKLARDVARSANADFEKFPLILWSKIDISVRAAHGGAQTGLNTARIMPSCFFLNISYARGAASNEK
jgi:hypothetical protein